MAVYQACPMLKAEDIIKEKTGVSVLYHQYAPTDRKGMHWHNYYTIDVVCSGEGVHHLNGCDYRIQKGDMTLIKPTDIHYLCSDKAMSVVSIRFVDRAIDHEYGHLVQYPAVIHRLCDEDLDLLTTYCKSIDRCNNVLGERPDDLLYLDELQLNFRLILVLLARQKNTVPSTSGSRITQTLQYLNVHFREQISLGRAAEIAGLNQTYFSAWFKKNVGKTYIEYINSCRIEYACSMLKNGSSVIESCFGSGFNSLSHFNHIFKNKLGQSPGEYKRRLGEKP